MDSATEFLFGSCVDSLSSTLPYPSDAVSVPAIQNPFGAEEANKFIAAFSDAMQQIAYRERMGTYNNRAKSMAVISKYLEPIAHQALERNKTRGRQSEEPEDSTLLDDFVEKTSGKSQAVEGRNVNAFISSEFT
ncbi:hypothetical protein DFH08DRAFT_951119 [Mycena albidolilacea]|uniref:Uncharacterized protein n=1 Tax=Mycena albidolilacea TaxID=1033008 RepID=A0AAD7F1E7_9AGAR|nr:hypothetical protein DFH08DRAFT_951119 [Mycena albidolilacea]